MTYHVLAMRELRVATRRAALGCAAAFALACGPAGGGQPQVLGPLELQEVLERHVASLGGPAALGGGDLLISGTEETEGRRFRTRILVRREPFGYREELEQLDPPQRTWVTISNGRRAWRLRADGQGDALDAETARTYLERAYVEGFLYMDQRRNRSAAGIRELERLDDYPGLPGGFERGRSIRVVNFPSPAGTTLQFYFDPEDGRLLEVISSGLEPVQWVRFGAWRPFGGLNLPSQRAIGALGLPPLALIRIERVEVVASHPAELFLGDPAPATPPLQVAGELLVRPLSVPGAAHLELRGVQIDGGDPVGALLDTGAGWVTLRPAFAARLQLPYRGERPLAAPVGAVARTCWIDSLTLGSRRRLQVVGAALPLPGFEQFNPDPPPELVLGGYELIADSPILDLEGRRLLFRGEPVIALSNLPDADHPESASRVALVPFRREPGDTGSILLDISLNGQALPAVLDTGFGPMLRLTRAALVRAGLAATRDEWLARGAVPATVGWAGGVNSEDLVVQLETFQLGPVVYRDPIVYLGGLDRPDESGDAFVAMLGAGSLLAFARVGIDATRSFLEVEPGSSIVPAPSGLLEVPGPGTFLGLVITCPPATAAAGRSPLPLIRGVGQGTAAARGELRPGDRLLAIDGIPCAGRPLHTFARRLWLAPGAAVELEILTADGARRTVRLPG